MNRYFSKLVSLVKSTSQPDGPVAQRKAQMRRCAAAPEVVIYGVVGARSGSCSRVPPATEWHFSAELIAWRQLGHAVCNDTLRVSKVVTDAEFEESQSAFEANTIVAFRAKLPEESVGVRHECLVVKMLAPPVDPELEVLLRAALEPVCITDSVLGTLTLDKGHGWYEGKISWQGQDTEIFLNTDEDGELPDAVRNAKLIVQELAEWVTRAKTHAADFLLDTKNDNWLQDSEEDLSEDQFVSRLSLTSIVVYPSGDFDFFFDDGGLFWGHSVEVTGSLAEGMSGAAICG